MEKHNIKNSSPDGLKKSCDIPNTEHTSKNPAENQLCKLYDVKSSAIVKYESVSPLSEFNMLQANTNLNEPPKNWMRASSKYESFVRNVSLKTNHLFTSFEMAHTFPECVGDIDIITDSENIKQLLKMPLSKAPVSMMVHKVGRTVLIDEFDIHRHLLRKQKNDWEWLRKFYSETLRSHVELSTKKNKSRDYLQDRNMFSKFLYYSLPDPKKEKSDEHLECKDLQASTNVYSFLDIFPLGKKHEEEYQRTCVWSFEDLTMLIGTDLPIFGDVNHPCVSLRLRDTQKPINVLTGIDYWLDNLMCNVPELAMCYHMNGVVQEYLLYKTEEIPNLENSKFKPQVIKDIAQNILLFLKTNATKEGHTYWLFRGENDEYVKLYDLTSLYNDETTSKEFSGSGNPFTGPVGLLLYRVAQKMMQTDVKKKAGTVKTLLTNCINLIDKEEHKRIITSAHYLLSDLYTRDDLDEESDYDSDFNMFDEDNVPENDTNPNSISIKQLLSSDYRISQWSGNSANAAVQNDQYKRLPNDVKEKSAKGLEHIVLALKSIRSSLEKISITEKHTVEEQACCDPSKAIPLHYKPLSLKNWKSESLVEYSSRFDWHHELKILLLAKSGECYTNIAYVSMEEKMYGDSLYFIKKAIYCFESCNIKSLPEKNIPKTQSSKAICLGILGDTLVTMERSVRDGENVDRLLKTTDHVSDIENIVGNDIVDSAAESFIDKNFAYDWIDDTFKKLNNEEMLLHAAECYQTALKLLVQKRQSFTDADLMKRAGNVWNELGMLFMHNSKKSYETSNDEKTFRKYTNKAIDCFERGLKSFQVEDYLNKSILHNNIGTILRLCAEAHNRFCSDRVEFSVSEGKYFKTAANHFQKSLQLLEKVKDFDNVQFIDNIRWNLSSTYFSLGTLMQDHPPVSTMAEEQIEEKVTNYLLHALESCKVDPNSAKYPTCQYREATIHHRLASLYHNTLRNQSRNASRLKRLKKDLNKHYDEALRIFKELEGSTECIRIILERIAFCEYTLKNQTEYSIKLNTLKTGLGLCLFAIEPLNLIKQQLRDNQILNSSSDIQQAININENEVLKLEAILRSRLLATLLGIVQLNSTVKGKNVPPISVIEFYKSLYKEALKSTAVQYETVTERCDQLHKCLKSVKELIGSADITLPYCQ